MNIQTAITHLKTGHCACKHIEQALEKLAKLVDVGIHQARVIFTPRLVILETGGGREVLCSHFLDQRD